MKHSKDHKSSDSFDEQIPEEAFLAADTLADWHLDIRRPQTSVVFQFSDITSSNSEVRPHQTPESLYVLMRVLIKKLMAHEEQNGHHSFTIDVQGTRFRAELIRPGRYALRKVNRKVSNLLDLNLGNHIVELLEDHTFRNGGLILIAGSPGAGKSTTAAATIVSRLKKYGGYALTIEAPIECMFEGFHGDGYAEQIDASVNGFKIEVATAMRKFPTEIKSMFFVGEIIDEVSAAELTRLIGRGHLVITTIHAKDLIRAVQMLVALAERGGETFARQLIGGSLLAVIHQELVKRKPIVRMARINESMKNIISNPEANLALLANEIDLADRQNAKKRAMLKSRDSSNNFEVKTG